MKPSLLLCIVTIFFASGCSSARYVMKEGDLGIISVARPSDGNWEKAHELMQQHFPNGYQVVREEEVPVGVTTHVNQHGSGDKSIVTKDKTEYHIHYVSNSSNSQSVTPANFDSAATVTVPQ